MNPGSRRQNTVLYIAILAGCFVVGVGGWLTPIGRGIDNLGYDALVRSSGKADAASLRTSAVVVAIDEPALRTLGGVGSYRQIEADAIEQLRGRAEGDRDRHAVGRSFQGAG